MYRWARKLSNTTPYDYGFCAVRNLRGEQIHVSAELPEMSSDMRPMVSERQSGLSSGRRRYDRRRNGFDEIKPFSAIGVRGGIGLTLLSVIFLCVLAFGLWSHTRVTGTQKSVSLLANQVARSEESLESVKLAYEGSLASLDVAYNARNLGLISAKSVEAIMLYAPEDAHFSPADTEPVLPGDTLATILGY